jgi:hypothetical protein
MTHFKSQNDLKTTLKFNDIKQVARCEECPFFELCPLIDREDVTYISVVAFTGMVIGIFPIVRDTLLFIEVETKKGQLLRFDRKSGVQTNCNNSRYANRVEPNDIPPYTKGKAE